MVKVRAAVSETVLICPDQDADSVVVPALPGCVTWGLTLDEWQVARRYFSAESLTKLRKEAAPEPAPALLATG